MKEAIRPALVSLLAFTVLCGFAYPFALDAIAALAFRHQATGSLIRDPRGRVVGSELVGQPFGSPGYFWSRPASGPNLGAAGFVDARGQLGPNPALLAAVRQRIDALHAADPANVAPVPVDLVTASSSGLDPDISPAAAAYQVGRVARARGVPEAAVRRVVEAHTEGRTFGVLGEPRVNVVAVNRALDARFGRTGPAPRPGGEGGSR